MIKSVVLIAIFVGCNCDDLLNKPAYKYKKYETEDVMKAAASNIPFQGYQIVEGGYYPIEVGGGIGGLGTVGFLQNGGGGGITGGGGMGGGGGGQYIIRPIGLVGGGIGGGIGGGGLLTHIGYGGSGIGQGGIGMGNAGGGGIGNIGGIGLIGTHTFGGEALEKGQFSEGKKKANDEKYHKQEGKKGEEINQGEAGFNKGQVAVTDVKGDAGYYKNVGGGKKVYEDGKEYQGGQHFNKEGKNEEQKQIKQGHKKGHKIKSFKTSHHKDETGKTEEYYDESHDEGDNYAFKGEAGNFGEKAEAAFKGNNEEGKYKQEEEKKEGHFKNENLLNKANANEGQFGGKKYAGEEVIFGNKNGAEDHSLLGHQESSKFYKHQPMIVPFHQ